MANWNFLSSAFNSGINSAMQFGQLDSQRDANQRAQESHEAQMQDREQERARAEELRKVQAEIFRERKRGKEKQPQGPSLPKPPPQRMEAPQQGGAPRDPRISEPTQPILPRRRPEKPGGDAPVGPEGMPELMMGDQPVGREQMPELMMDPRPDGSKPVGQEGMPEMMMGGPEGPRRAQLGGHVQAMADPQFRRQRMTDLQTVSAMLQDPESADPESMRQAFNSVYRDLIQQGGPEGAQKELAGFMPDPNDEGSIVPILQVTRPDGSSYRAPLTMNRSDDPNDPVEGIPVEAILEDLDRQAMVAQELDRLAELEARAIELGDPSALEELRAMERAAAEQDMWKDRQQFNQGLNKGMAFLENELNTNRDFQQHYMKLEQMGMSHEQALEQAGIDFGYRQALQDDSQQFQGEQAQMDRDQSTASQLRGFDHARSMQDDSQGFQRSMQDDSQSFQHSMAHTEQGFRRDNMALADLYQTQSQQRGFDQERQLLDARQGFEAEQAGQQFQRQRALNQQQAALRPPEVVRDADGNAVALPGVRGQSALPVNKQIRTQTEANLLAQTQTGKPIPSLETARALENFPTEEPVRLPASSSFRSRDPNQVSAQDRAKLAQQIMADYNEGVMYGEEKMTIEEAMAQADQLLGRGSTGHQTGHTLPQPRNWQGLGGIERSLDAYGIPRR
jgi:hypothetical protein